MYKFSSIERGPNEINMTCILLRVYALNWYFGDATYRNCTFYTVSYKIIEYSQLLHKSVNTTRRVNSRNRQRFRIYGPFETLDDSSTTFHVGTEQQETRGCPVATVRLVS